MVPGYRSRVPQPESPVSLADNTNFFNQSGASESEMFSISRKSESFKRDRIPETTLRSPLTEPKPCVNFWWLSNPVGQLLPILIQAAFSTEPMRMDPITNCGDKNEAKSAPSNRLRSNPLFRPYPVTGRRRL